MKERKIIATEDGSSTVFVEELNETYHSKFGAINESEHIFIKSGLSSINKDCIRIFEMGFGTGLNAILTYIYAIKNNIKVFYYSIEKYPLSRNEYSRLNYYNNYQDIFIKLHSSEWEKSINISDNFFIQKYKVDIRSFKIDFPIDVCFYDAFDPALQPYLWTTGIFKNIYTSMNMEGVLSTYSAKGQVRRNLKSAGFIVEKLPGPRGKREITRAMKK